MGEGRERLAGERDKLMESLSLSAFLLGALQALIFVISDLLSISKLEVCECLP